MAPKRSSSGLSVDDGLGHIKLEPCLRTKRLLFSKQLWADTDRQPRLEAKVDAWPRVPPHESPIVHATIADTGWIDIF